MQPGSQLPSGGSWYPLKPQEVPSSVYDNVEGKWVAAGPVLVQNPNGKRVSNVLRSTDRSLSAKLYFRIHCKNSMLTDELKHELL